MSIRFISLTAIAMIGTAAPAMTVAAQTTPRPAGQAAKPAAAPATRAAVLRNLDGAFKAIDKNGNGTLDASELSAAEAKTQQQRVVALRGRVEQEFAKLDTNKDGSLSKAEFMAVSPQAPASTNNGAQMVGQLDKNKDGKVTADEYRAPILSRFDAMDSNKDGTLSEAERKAFASRQTAQKR